MQVPVESRRLSSRGNGINHMHGLHTSRWRAHRRGPSGLPDGSGSAGGSERSGTRRPEQVVVSVIPKSPQGDTVGRRFLREA